MQSNLQAKALRFIGGGSEWHWAYRYCGEPICGDEIKGGVWDPRRYYFADRQTRAWKHHFGQRRGPSKGWAYAQVSLHLHLDMTDTIIQDVKQFQKDPTELYGYIHATKLVHPNIRWVLVPVRDCGHELINTHLRKERYSNKLGSSFSGLSKASEVVLIREVMGLPIFIVITISSTSLLILKARCKDWQAPTSFPSTLIPSVDMLNWCTMGCGSVPSVRLCSFSLTRHKNSTQALWGSNCIRYASHLECMTESDSAQYSCR